MNKVHQEKWINRGLKSKDEWSSRWTRDKAGELSIKAYGESEET